MASKTDLDESVMIGTQAVLHALDGVTGVLMTYVRGQNEPYKVSVSCTDVSSVANQIKVVPDEFINDAGNGITDAGLRYLLPLIQGEVSPRYVNGLPFHLKLK